jgi:SpoVK/Ycf46/Vps4 family AAA+-type ATPase
MDKPVERLFAIDAETREMIILNIVTIWRLAEAIQGGDNHEDIADLCRDITMQADEIAKAHRVTDRDLLKADKDIGFYIA